MEQLYNIFLNVYLSELEKLKFGYTYDKQTLKYLDDLMNTIDYIENGDISRNDYFKIIQYYEENN